MEWNCFNNQNNFLWSKEKECNFFNMKLGHSFFFNYCLRSTAGSVLGELTFGRWSIDVSCHNYFYGLSIVTLNLQNCQHRDGLSRDENGRWQYIDRINTYDTINVCLKSHRAFKLRIDCDSLSEAQDEPTMQLHTASEHFDGIINHNSVADGLEWIFKSMRSKSFQLSYIYISLNI